MSDAASTYDEVPYTSFPYALSHPDRLATVGRLFGMEPAPLAEARILELGCAAGGNLIPIAQQLPGAQLVGVDLSARQVADGKAIVDELGLKNLTLRHADLTTIDESWGRFDYVLCHGVYSWVPPAVQDRILAICHDNTTPQGIAYVSYNTYPGWHMRESIRYMMQFHVDQFPDAKRQTEQAAALVDFLASAVAEDDVYGQLLRRELDVLARTTPEYLFHEHLEEHNHPVYFHRFAERLAAAGLQYLGEANVHTMLARELSPEVNETLGRISPDIIALEQYMDFVRNRQFRQTLVCKADLELDRNLRPELVPQFYVGFSGQAPTPLDLGPDVIQTFELDDELEVSSPQPITKAALAIALERWPEVVSFEALVDLARQRLVEAGIEMPHPEHADQQLAVDVLACFLQGTVELRTARPHLSVEPSERPSVSPFARWQASHGEHVTNGRHLRVQLDDTTRQLLLLLDGTRDRAALVDALVDLVAAGTLSVSLGDERITDTEAAREPLTTLVDRTLNILRDLGLLVG